MIKEIDLIEIKTKLKFQKIEEDEKNIRIIIRDILKDDQFYGIKGLGILYIINQMTSVNLGQLDYNQIKTIAQNLFTILIEEDIGFSYNNDEKNIIFYYILLTFYLPQISLNNNDFRDIIPNLEKMVNIQNEENFDGISYMYYKNKIFLLRIYNFLLQISSIDYNKIQLLIQDIRQNTKQMNDFDSNILSVIQYT